MSSTTCPTSPIPSPGQSSIPSRKRNGRDFPTVLNSSKKCIFAFILPKGDCVSSHQSSTISSFISSRTSKSINTRCIDVTNRHSKRFIQSSKLSNRNSRFPKSRGGFRLHQHLRRQQKRLTKMLPPTQHEAVINPNARKPAQEPNVKRSENKKSPAPPSSFSRTEPTFFP